MMAKSAFNLTPFGKRLRILRIEREEVLFDMAQKLGLSSSYISSVETGKRKITENLLNKLRCCYNLSDAEFETFKQAAEESRSSISLELDSASTEQKDLALSFAKKFNSLDKDTIRQINQLMNRR